MGHASWLRRGGAVASALAAGLVLTPGARGDWPSGRHDPQRTGAAAGRSDIRAPEEVWRYYLGGSLGITGLAVHDVDGNGTDDFIMVAGGSLVAKGADDRVIWSLPARAFTGIAGLRDLDGGGGPELVVTGAVSVAVVDAATGAVRWELPPGTMKQFGGVRLGDLDGDGLDDLVITESGPCAAAPGYWPGAVYGFAGGFGGDRTLWTLPTVVCGKGVALTLFDADGDGDLDMLEPEFDRVRVLDGATGTLRATSAAMGYSMPHLRCRDVEADGTAGAELVCMHSLSLAAADRSVMLLDMRGTAVDVVWRRYLAPAATGELAAIELVLDLGDGVPRVFVSARDAADQPWATHVFDARTGAPVTVLAGELVSGRFPRPAGGSYLVTINDDGLSGWRAGSGGVPALAWHRAGDEAPVMVSDAARAGVSALSLVAAVLPGAGRMVIAPRATPGVFRAIDAFDGGTQVAAEVALPPRIHADNAFVIAGGGDVAFAMSRSDGYLAPYDELLVLQTGIDLQRLPRTGGYVATGSFRQLAGPPRTADVDGDGRDEIVVGDSRGALVRLDTEHAALRAPPRPSWTRENASAPAIARDAGGAARIACIDRDVSAPGNPVYGVSLLDADGAPRWSSPLPGPPLSDLVCGNLDGDAEPDVVAQWGAPGDLFVQTRAYAGADGARLWEDSIEPGSGRSPAGVSIGPWPGQATEVVVHVAARRVWALAGPDGGVVAMSGDLPMNYFMPSLVELDGDAGREIAFTGGGDGVIVVDDDFGPWFTSADTKRPFPYGSIARCPDGAVVLASEALAAPPRLLLTTLAPGTSGMPIGTERALWLAGGAAFATEGEAAAGAPFLGQLTSSTSHADLTGRGRPSTLVGSSDGWLYAVDPCDGELDFAVEIGAAVGEAVYGDGDGDGKDEILVTAGDGYVRALQQHSIDPPAWVSDLDPATGGVDDVDVLPVRETLGARWAAVPGAASYQVAVVDRDGDHVLTPPWRDSVGTELSFPDVSTDAERTLFVLVRAVGPDGKSVDAASDGVTLVAEAEPPEPGSPGGCCDSGASGSAGLTLLVLLGLSRPSSGRRRAARRG